MKKRISKLVALIMAVVLMFSISISAAATGNSVGKFEKDTRVYDPFDPMQKPIGIFALRLRMDSQMTYMTAFLVKDGSSSYILTHEAVAPYVEEGYELTLMSYRGKKHDVTFLGLDEGHEVAYLYADGMMQYEPLDFSKDPYEVQIALVRGMMNRSLTEAKDVEFRNYEFARFRQLNDLYFVIENREITLEWLGSPVMPDKNILEVQGMCVPIQDKTDEIFLGIISFRNMHLENGYALEGDPLSFNPQEEEPVQTEAPQTEPAATHSQPEAKPVEEEKSEGGSGMGIIVVLILLLVVGGAGFYFYKNKDVLLKKRAAVPFKGWILRCTSGPLNGLVFPLSGAVRIGCGTGVAIRFPKNTMGISDNHCDVMFDGNGVVIRDLNSEYGTFISINRLTPGEVYALSDGDVFTLAPNGPAFQVEYNA